MQGLFHPHVLLISFLVHGSFQDTNHKENVLHWFLGMMGCYSTNGKQESEILKFWIGPQNLENSLSGLFLFQKIRYWFPKPRVKPKKKKKRKCNPIEKRKQNVFINNIILYIEHQINIKEFFPITWCNINTPNHLYSSIVTLNIGNGNNNKNKITSYRVNKYKTYRLPSWPINSTDGNHNFSKIFKGIYKLIPNFKWQCKGPKMDKTNACSLEEKLWPT